MRELRAEDGPVSLLGGVCEQPTHWCQLYDEDQRLFLL